MNARSVGESSTTMIFLIVIVVALFASWNWLSGGTALGEMRFDGSQQAFLGEGLGEVFVGAHHAAARAVEEAALRRKHAPRRRPVRAALLDEGARLVAVQPPAH